MTILRTGEIQGGLTSGNLWAVFSIENDSKWKGSKKCSKGTEVWDQFHTGST